MKIRKNNLIVIFVMSALITSLGFFALKGARHSRLFQVKKIEIVQIDEILQKWPVSQAELLALSGIDVGSTNIFQIDLSEIRRKMKLNSWIEDIEVQTLFPNSVEIGVKFKKALGLYSIPGKKPYYISTQGESLGEYQSQFVRDVPLILGAQAFKNLDKIAVIGEVFSEFKESQFRVTQIYLEQNRVQLLVKYLGLKVWRGLMIQIDDNISMSLQDVRQNFGRIAKVLTYLSEHEIDANKIVVSNEKKMIVNVPNNF